MTWYLLLIVAATTVFSVLLTGFARRIAPFCGLVDKPDGGRKRHAKPTPVMGGIAMCAAISLSTLIVFQLFPLSHAGQPLTVNPALFLSSLLMCLLGFVDDRWNLRPRSKLIGQVAACLPYVLLSSGIDRIQLLGVGIDLGWASLPFTLFWLVACSNVINLTDGLDGLAGSISLIAVATIAALSGWYGQTEVFVFSSIVVGAIVGFLIHNWPPAKIFMGDAGSLTLGFLIGALAIEANLKQATGFMMGTPLVLISIPVFDTLMAILRRKLNGKAIGAADRRHIHHRLQDKGLTRTQTLLALIAICSALAVATLVSVFLEKELIALAICGATLIALIAAKVFGDEELRLFLRHVEAVGTMLADSSGVFRSRLLLARLNGAHCDRWADYCSGVCQRVAEMGGEMIEFVCHPAEQMQTPLPISRAIFELRDPTGHTATKWHFDYAAEREDGIRAIVRARGSGDAASNRQRIDDLFRLFDAMCRDWPFDEMQNHLETMPADLPVARNDRSSETSDFMVIPLHSPVGVHTAHADKARRAA